MDPVFTTVTVASLGMLVAGVALQVRTFSRRRPVRPIAIAIGQAAAVGSMVVFSVVLGRPPGLLEWALILPVGIAGGLAYGGLIRVERTAAGIVMAYTLPWLLIWAGLLLVTQGAAALTGRLPWVMCSLAILNMALNLGMNGRVVARARGLRLGGFAAATLLAMVLAGALAFAPAGVQPARADGATCAEGEVPGIFSGLLPPGGIDGTLSFSSTRSGDDGRAIVHIAYHKYGDPISDDFEVDVYRSAADATASMAAWIAETAENPVETWVKLGDGAAREYSEKSNPDRARFFYLGISGAAYVELIHDVTSDDADVRRASDADSLFASVMAAAGALDPAAVFALAATESCDGTSAGNVPGSGEPGEPGQPGSPAEPGQPSPGEPGSPGDPGGPRPGTGAPAGGGVAGIGDLLSGEPVGAGTLALGSGLANGILLLGSLGQFLLAGGGARPGGVPAPGGGPGGGPGGAPGGVPGGIPPNWTPTGDGRFWYRAPWEDGGPVPMTTQEVAGIEGMLRAGYVWSRTDGWVTPEQGAANEAMRARQRAIDRAESEAAAADFHRRIQAARDAQAAARQEIINADRRLEIIDEMAASEREHAADLARLGRIEAVGRVVVAAEYAGDIAAIGLGIFGGPLGIAVRAGYRTLKGTAGGLGTAIADDAGWGETNRRMYLGTVRGAAAAGVELAIDTGVRKLFGLPPLFPAAPVPAVIPPALLAPRALVRQVVGEAAEIAKTKGVDAAAKAVDPATVLRLFKDGGMQTLGQLEQAGAISATEAQIIRRVLTSEVNGAVAAGTRDAAREFAGRSGVRLQEVLVGDSGSSAAGRAGSVVTDADRTFQAVFQPDDLAAYARQHGISQAEAAARLNRELTVAVEEKVAANLRPNGLTPKDVGYSGYSGFGSKAGPADSYAAGFTRTRQAVQGDTLVVRPDGTTYRAGRDAILDAEGLAAGSRGGAMPPAQPTVPTSEFAQLGGRQVEAIVAHADPKSVAKAVDRVAYLAGRSGIPLDSTVAAAARAIRAEPQRVGEILERFGLTADDFRARALETSRRFMDELGRAGR